MTTEERSANTITIYDHMLLNQQSISIKIKPAFNTFFKNQLEIDDVTIHASNVYLFSIPLNGEFTALNQHQKQFVFENEVALYEAQFEIEIPYENTLFDAFFEITWHGVVYHGEIKTL